MENKKERVFSVELKSKKHLKNVTLASGSTNTALIEGTLGELVQATFKEGLILEVIGKKGVLRIDLEENEIKQISFKEQVRKATND